MKEKPIIFNSEMVKAILDGRKTQTRRVIKTKPNKDGYWYLGKNQYQYTEKEYALSPYAKYKIGDRLWVRETWSIGFNTYDFKTMKHKPAYRADFSDDTKFTGGKWKPSIHMPRWASRITLEITDVRVERVRDISEEDGIKEGIEYIPCRCRGGCSEGEVVEKFKHLWNSLHKKKDRWEDNPWVWVISFKRL